MSATLPLAERRSGLGSTTRDRDKQLVWSIFAICAIACMLALLMLPGKILGFAVAFGSALVAYESILVVRRISRGDPAQTGVPTVPGAKRRAVWT